MCHSNHAFAVDNRNFDVATTRYGIYRLPFHRKIISRRPTIDPNQSLESGVTQSQAA